MCKVTLIIDVNSGRGNITLYFKETLKWVEWYSDINKQMDESKFYNKLVPLKNIYTRYKIKQTSGVFLNIYR